MYGDSIEKSMSRSLKIGKPIFRNGARIGHILSLNSNGKPHMGSAMILSHLTLGDLQRSKSRSLRFRSIIFWKEAELQHVLLLNINMISNTITDINYCSQERTEE